VTPNIKKKNRAYACHGFQTAPAKKSMNSGVL